MFIPPRLLTPMIPYPWESLGSALSRAARKMNHPYPDQLLFHPGFTPRTLSEFSKDGVPLPGYASNKMLAHFLQIPVEGIPRLTGSDLVISLGLPRYGISRQRTWLTELDLRSWLLPELRDTTRVCPYCTKDQEGYDRVFWNLRGVLCCPRHNARLLEECPICLKAIPAIRPSTNRCPFCSSATYMLSATHLPNDSVLIAGTSLLLTKLNVPLSEATSAFRFLKPSPLLTAKPVICPLICRVCQDY